MLVFRRLLHLLATLLMVLVHFSGIAVGSRVVEVGLNIATYAGSEDECIGRDVGLTNTSIMLQYRLFESSAAPPQQEWTFLAEVSISGEQVRSHSIILPSDLLPRGLQFRLLQLEHGGKGCNCWEVEEFTAALHVPNSAAVSLAAFTNINKFECFSRGQQNAGKQTFCFGSGNEARGVITKALYFGGEVGAECPGNSDSMLISPKGMALPENCDSVNPRM